MKKIISFSLAVVLIALSIEAQNIEIETLEDINSFNHDTVDNLYIHNTTELSSIYGFATLKGVRKDFIISGNAITSISGFDNLTIVSGNLIIENNDLLESVNAFNNLAFIGKRFNLDGINASEISGFSSLSNAKEITIAHCQIKNLNFLNQLEHVETGIEISENDSLQNINSLSKLTTTGYIKILDNMSLENLHGFSSLNNVLSVNFYGNASLINLSGLEELKTVINSVVIWGNPGLISINALENLSSVGGNLSIHDNINLSACWMISDLLTTPDAVKGNVDIYNNMPGCDYASLFTVIPSNEAQNIAVYPNPTCSESIIDFGNTSHDYSLRIYSTSGHLVHCYHNINSPFTIQWDNDERGVYFYQIGAEYREIQNGRIIVE